MQAEIKLATVQDIARICEVLNQALDKKLRYEDTTWDTEPFEPKEIEQSITNKVRYSVWVDSVIVGTFVLWWEDKKFWGEQPSTALYIHQLAIGDSYRGKGIGLKIFEWVNKKAKENNKKLVRIDFSPDNERLKKYYEQLGFNFVKNRQIKSEDKDLIVSLYERSV